MSQGTAPALKECAERLRLLAELDRATAALATAAHELSSKMGTLPEPDYDRLRADVEGVRLDLEHAREALAHHRREHGC